MSSYNNANLTMVPKVTSVILAPSEQPRKDQSTFQVSLLDQMIRQGGALTDLNSTFVPPNVDAAAMNIFDKDRASIKST